MGDETFKTHLDGFNQIGMLTNGEPTQHAVFYYFTDRGDLACLRYDRWKVVLMQQNLIGLDVWSDPLAELRMPRIIDLRTDPFERAPEMSGNYETWMIQHAFIGYPVRDYAQDFPVDLHRLLATPGTGEDPADSAADRAAGRFFQLKRMSMNQRHQSSSF